jgi:hypothetical protein
MTVLFNVVVVKWMLEEFTMQDVVAKQGHASLKLQGCKAKRRSHQGACGKRNAPGGFGWNNRPLL